MSRTVHRARNAVIRLVKRLPPSSRAVSPEVDSDLYQAHLAVYRFCSRFASERRCLDVGCGTGYGAAELAGNGGAVEVVGIDPDLKSIAYARRRYGGAARFEVQTAEALGEEWGEFGLITACNVLAQLEEAAAGLVRMAARLEEDGTFVASVPPILDAQAMDFHRTRTSHRSNHYLWEWEELLRSSFGSLRLFRQEPPPGLAPDFGDPGPSRVKARAYAFEELPLADLYDVGSLAALFVCTEPSGGGGPQEPRPWA